MERNRKSFYGKKLMFGLVALFVLLTGCGINPEAGSSNGGSTPASSSAGTTGGAASGADKVVTLATNAEPNFNPWSPTGYVESEPITELLFDGLTKWGTDYQPVADLATDWSTSEDGLTWTFNLQKDVKWSDGEPFTPDDVAYTFNNIVLNKDLGANGASNFGSVKEVVVSGDNQVQFKLSSPWSSLPNYLAWYAKVLPKHIFDGQDPWSLTSFNKENPVGTGPYSLVNYSPGQSVELKSNPDYFGGAPSIGKVIFSIIPDVNTQIAQLMSGTLSMVSISDPTLLEKLKSNSNLTINEVPDNNYYWIALDQKQERFQDVRVRQALLYAIDREAIIKGVLKGYGSVATGPIAPIQEAYYDKDVQQYPYDPDKAKSLLEEAGYKLNADGYMAKDGKVLEISMPAGQYGVLVAASQLVQQYWEKVGVKVDLKVIDWNTYVQQVVSNRQYDATLCWWRSPLDPDILSYYHSSAAETGNNIPGYKNPDLDKLLEAGREASSTEDRVAIYKQVQELTAKELPYLYLWNPTLAVAMQKNLTTPKTTFIVAEDHISDWTLNP